MLASLRTNFVPSESRRFAGFGEGGQNGPEPLRDRYYRLTKTVQGDELHIGQLSRADCIWTYAGEQAA